MGSRESTSSMSLKGTPPENTEIVLRNENLPTYELSDF
jgi:hypothetical protein